ncbi:MAG: hypothetical protein IKX24_10440 [Prevotella sp.]|nr:hypothetical protein [Prevotella sp.]
MKDERLKMKNEGGRKGRTACGNYPKLESKLNQNSHQAQSGFCSDFELILLNFSPKAIA